jgi:hypothetical protein
MFNEIVQADPTRAQLPDSFADTNANIRQPSNHPIIPDTPQRFSFYRPDPGFNPIHQRARLSGTSTIDFVVPSRLSSPIPRQIQP